MRWIQCEQAPQKLKIDQPAVTGIPIQRMLSDQKRGALPANDVRVRYQPTRASQIHTGGGVIQCCGLGSFLCCCCDDVSDMETPADVSTPVVKQTSQAASNRGGDGPCAVRALKRLKWESGYNEKKGSEINKIQNSAFKALGIDVTEAALNTLKSSKVMVLFFHTDKITGNDDENSVAFHVMYTDGKGNLRGTNNSPDILSIFNVSVNDVAAVKEDELSFKIGDTLNPNARIEVKYVTQDEYLSLYPPCC